jgi:hypothetical protein
VRWVADPLATLLIASATGTEFPESPSSGSAPMNWGLVVRPPVTTVDTVGLAVEFLRLCRSSDGGVGRGKRSRVAQLVRASDC